MKEITEENYLILDSLAGMWNQYCPPMKDGFPGHMFMSAGEEAEEVLCSYGLLRDNNTAIERYDDDYPFKFNRASL